LDVSPEKNFTHQVLKTPTWTEAARREAIELEKDFLIPKRQKREPISKGTFVIFKVEQPSWSQTTEGQTGIHPDALKTPFGLGQVVQNFDIDESNEQQNQQDDDQDQVQVHIWYAESAGDPNLTWKPWIKKDSATSKSQNWVLGIPRDSILISDIPTNKKGKYGIQLSAKSKQQIAKHPLLDYGYVQGLGLVTKDEAREALEQDVQETKGGRSKKAIRAHKTARTKLLTHNKLDDIKSMIKTRSSKAARTQSVKGTAPDTESEPYSEHSSEN